MMTPEERTRSGAHRPRRFARIITFRLQSAELSPPRVSDRATPLAAFRHHRRRSTRSPYRGIGRPAPSPGLFTWHRRAASSHVRRIESAAVGGHPTRREARAFAVRLWVGSSDRCVDRADAAERPSHRRRVRHELGAERASGARRPPVAARARHRIRCDGSLEIASTNAATLCGCSRVAATRSDRRRGGGLQLIRCARDAAMTAADGEGDHAIVTDGQARAP
jgi:hypothetical protein